MDKMYALQKLELLKDKTIEDLLPEFPDITKFSFSGKLNKGWAGQLIERYLGLPLNSSRSPNGGSWELKTVSLKQKRDGKIVPQETIAITMVDEIYLKNEDPSFLDSHLYTKLKRLIVVSRLAQQGKTSKVISVVEWDSAIVPSILLQIESEYNKLKEKILTEGLENVHSDEGTELIQIRTKGMGKGAKKTKAFYMKKKLVSIILQL
jgi:DNA mismatch repair protein MutH